MIIPQAARPRITEPLSLIGIPHFGEMVYLRSDACLSRMWIFFRDQEFLAEAMALRGWIFRQLLREVRIELAQRYIRDGRYNVADIAYMSGYGDSAAFTRAFRDWVGAAPTVYRTQCVGLPAGTGSA